MPGDTKVYSVWNILLLLLLEEVRKISRNSNCMPFDVISVYEFVREGLSLSFSSNTYRVSRFNSINFDAIEWRILYLW